MPDIPPPPLKSVVSMALAGTTWDDYRGGPALPSQTLGGPLFARLVMGTALVACTVAGFQVLHGVRFPDFAAPAAPAAVATRHADIDVTGPLQSNAVRFLRESLVLTRHCRAGCAGIATEIGEAKRYGRLAPAASRNFGPVPMGLPLQQRFAPQVAAASPSSPEGTRPRPAAARSPVAPAPAPAVMAAPLVPAPVRISPSVVVPLPVEAIAVGAPAPVPAPRPAERETALSAPADSPVASIEAPAGRTSPLAPAPIVGRNDGTAVYDISAATVYMPDGARLEAHSGLGSMVDNPRYVDRRNIGPTPPGTYDLQALGGLFYGVEALRMVPVRGVNTFGRDGFLTHTYMLRGRPAQSNGCVVFPNYARFLDAYKRGHVKRLVVVASLNGSPMQVASAGSGR
jgi:hypothetical protein